MSRFNQTELARTCPKRKSQDEFPPQAEEKEPEIKLTGSSDEWERVDGVNDAAGDLYQNIKCRRVFKDDNGAYDIKGKMMRQTDGDGNKSYYSSSDSNTPLTFPYIVKTVCVDV